MRSLALAPQVATSRFMGYLADLLYFIRSRFIFRSRRILGIGYIFGYNLAAVLY
jgi:hypothetical protein